MNTKQDLLKLLNKQNAYISTRKINDLKINYVYEIKLFKSISTQFGPAIVITLVDDNDESLFNVFLPKRFASILTEELIARFNNDKKHTYKLKYLGGKYNDIEFQ